MEQLTEKILDYYREKYDVEYDAELFGLTVPYFAKRSDRQERTIFGFKLGDKKSFGPKASEYVFIFNCDELTAEIIESVKTLLISAEEEYVTPDRDHSFSFLSAILISGEIEKNAENAIKKFKRMNNYRAGGFTVLRIAALTPEGSFAYNKDGKDLKNLLFKLINI